MATPTPTETMRTAAPEAPVGTTGSVVGLILAASVGGAVALSLGLYGRLHEPTGQPIDDFGFSSLPAMKAWITTSAATLGLVQATSAAWMWGRLPGLGATPGWVAPAHRWLGTVAFVATLPVAYHCLWSLGFQTTTPRVVVHSLLGCAFYGAVATKLLVLRSERLAAWAVPIVGGLLVTVLTVIWFTSSYWYFTTISFPGL